MSQNRLRRRGPALPAAVSAVVLGLATLTACGPTVVSGTAQRDPIPEKDDVVVGQLNTGNYPTRPQAALGNAGNAVKGGLIESRRLAENLVMPFEVDAALSQVGALQSGVIKDTPALARALPQTLLQGFTTTFIAGFTALADSPRQSQDDPGYKSLQNTVVRLAGDADASAAVADLATRSAAIKAIGDSEPKPTSPVPLPRHPESRAVSYTSGTNNVVFSYTAHGPYLLIQTTMTRGGAGASAELAAATLDKQIPLIDRFEPTPVAKLPDLPLDPDGLLARTLPPEDNSVDNGLYGPHGILSVSSDPAGDQKLLTEAGVDRVARSVDTVYRAKDRAAATHVAEAYAAAVQKMGFTPTAAVPGMPAARCLVKSDPAGSLPGVTYCVVGADRYIVEVTAAKDVIAQQRISAQYLMLTAP